jgi:hypothetical protein
MLAVMRIGRSASIEGQRSIGNYSEEEGNDELL